MLFFFYHAHWVAPSPSLLLHILPSCLSPISTLLQPVLELIPLCHRDVSSCGVKSRGSEASVASGASCGLADAGAGLRVYPAACYRGVLLSIFSTAGIAVNDLCSGFLLPPALCLAVLHHAADLRWRIFA